jgi:ABC-type uncharacterized transport system ATPase subunit
LRSGLLSGGNQQKLVMAREIDRHPMLLIGQPTRGVDLGAIELHPPRADQGCATQAQADPAGVGGTR